MEGNIKFLNDILYVEINLKLNKGVASFRVFILIDARLPHRVLTSWYGFRSNEVKGRVRVLFPQAGSN